MANKLAVITLGNKRLYELSANPSIDGFAANLGDIALANGKMYIKSGELNTNWTQMAEASQLNDYILSSERGIANGVATLNADGKLALDQIPAIAITDTFVVASQEAMLELSTAEQGDVAVRKDINKTFILTNNAPSILGSWQELLTPTDAVQSVNGKSGTVVLSTSDINEGTNLYYTDARVRATTLTGLSLVDSPIIDTDSMLSAMGKAQGQIGGLAEALSDEVDARIDADDALNDRLVPIEEMLEFQSASVYENNAAVIADGQPGVEDVQFRDGWYYQNLAAGQKINWYFFDGTTQASIQKQDFSMYSVVTLDSVASLPIMALYTMPTGVNDIMPGFAHSRYIFSSFSQQPVVGKKYLFYVGNDPAIFPELPRIKINLTSGQGEQLPTELVFTTSFGTNSGASVGSVKLVAEHLGVSSPDYKADVELRIRPASLVKLEALTSRVSTLEIDMLKDGGFASTPSDAGTFSASAANRKIVVTTAGGGLGKVIVLPASASLQSGLEYEIFNFSVGGTVEVRKSDGVTVVASLTQGQKAEIILTVPASESYTPAYITYLRLPLAAMNAGDLKIINVAAPELAKDAANKQYVDGKVTDAIVDGVTTVAPSQNAVFDALALKADSSSVEANYWKNGASVADLYDALVDRYFGTKSGDFDIVFARNSVEQMKMKADMLEFKSGYELKGLGQMVISAIGSLYRKSQSDIEELKDSSDVLISRMGRIAKRPVVADLDATKDIEFASFSNAKDRVISVKAMFSCAEGNVASWMKTIHVSKEGSIILTQDDFTSRNAGAVGVELSVVSFASNVLTVSFSGMGSMTEKMCHVVFEEEAAI